MSNIKQKLPVLKIATSTLSFSEMGDVLCSSTTPITINLPSASKGLWYRIGNINSGAITVTGTSTVATLAENEQVLILTTGTTWYDFKGVAGTGSTGHDRLHSMDSALDHATATAGDYGKFIVANATAGNIEFLDNFIVNITSAVDYQSLIYLTGTWKNNSPIYYGSGAPATPFEGMEWDYEEDSNGFFSNMDGGHPDSIYGGMSPIDGGGVV